MAETLKSSRLLLRAAEESDLDASYAIRGNEDVMRYWYDIDSFLPLFQFIIMISYV